MNLKNSVVNSIRLSKRKFRYFQQRLTRGFDDSETWSLDYSLAKIILPRLERYKEIVKDSCTEADWNNCDDTHVSDLDKMIEAFKFAGSEERWSASKEEYLKHQEGLNLFAEKYFTLWW